MLKRINPDEIPAVSREPVDAETLGRAAEIVAKVRDGGAEALREVAVRYGDREPGEPLLIDPDAMRAALDAIDPGARTVLESAAGRIRAFAEAQRASVRDFETEPAPGVSAGQWVAPVERAGCYAPGGRYPLPSSVLMTAVTARAAGVSEVVVASPKPALVTLAAASIAGADAVLACGGAQAIAAMAYGAGDLVSPCDAIVGPGNRWVTAAKQLVSGVVRIDMLAGPSELVVFADASADAATVAADLLAQAEHDTDARAILVTTDAGLAGAVDAELLAQLETLPTADTARAALGNGFAVVVGSVEEGIAVCDRIAPEHLELHLDDAAGVAPRLAHWGGLFIGAHAAEVLGDYGAGPNHTLPTGGTARSNGGLSVFDFLRVRTWIDADGGAGTKLLAQESAKLARLEGLEAHARSAERRL